MTSRKVCFGIRIGGMDSRRYLLPLISLPGLGLGPRIEPSNSHLTCEKIECNSNLSFEISKSRLTISTQRKMRLSPSLHSAFRQFPTNPGV
jgi:hypothetical protein